MNVSLAEVLAGARAHVVPLTAECVGYLVLGAADQLSGAPRRVAAGDLLLFEDGLVRVAGGRAAQPLEAERDLRATLDALLLPASAASAGLLRASRRPAGSGLDGFVRELETALIPVNRSAAKRALARLHRDTRKALEAGRIPVETAGSAKAEAPPAPVDEPAPFVAREPTPAPLPAVEPVALFETAVIPKVTVTPVVAGAVETVERTLVLAPVAPRVAGDADLPETRPEPVMLRATTRPAPPMPADLAADGERGHTEPLPLPP
ncbi:MAG TPA: hypothetical protein VGQ57_19840, partial [Polyangiaceae bacterium]|nr:hypothetical protein [Polyangiaceae bacterium]